MSLRYLLDTNIVSEPLRAAPEAAVLEKIQRLEAEIALPAPVWHEMIYGLERLPPSRKREAIEAYLRQVIEPVFPILPYDRIAAGWHARERARLHAEGYTPPFADSQIAAIASCNRLVLVTRNLKDFSRFRDLEVEAWH